VTAAPLTSAEILALPMEENDSGERTVRGYLIRLLALVWHDGEGFNGKRPFGNSGWEGDIYAALVRAGAIDGELDEHGYLETLSWDEESKGQRIVTEAITSLR
jgi:hypothetical protein